MKHFRVYWVTCVVAILFASVASATTIVMPTDEQLVAKSPVIVEGTVIGTSPVDRNGRIWTETTVSVDNVLKGKVPPTITIGEIGGEIGDRITKIFGAPEYRSGERVLLFLTPTPRGDYQTVDLFVGKFTGKQTLDGHALWTRHDEGAEVTLLDANLQPIAAKNVQRAAAEFKQYVEDRVAGRKGNRNYGVENPVIAGDSTSSGGGRRATDYFTLISEGTVYRWFAFDNGGSASWYSNGQQAGYSGGGLNEVQTAMAVWNDYSAAKIRYVYAGAESGPAGSVGGGPNGVNEIIFNDPNQEIGGSWNRNTGGVVGLGGFNGVSGASKWTAPFTADSSHTAGTYTAYNITEANLTIQDGVSASAGIPSSTLAEICAHEFGHTLGFGHSADSTALMYATVTGIGPSLRTDDQIAARWLYPSGSGTPPTPSVTVPAAPTGLTAAAYGSNGATLRWSDNASNETGESVYYSLNGSSYAKAGDVAAGSTQATLTGLSAGSYSFYVVAFNSAGQSSPSNSASVTIGSTTQTLQAAFSVSPSSGIAGQTTFSFYDQSSGSISARSWNFGDGGTSTAANPTHVYAAAGTYSVSLTVSSGSSQSTTSQLVTVTAPLATLTAAFSFSPASPTTQQGVSFFDQSTGGVTAWSWSFGDGSTSYSQNPVKTFAVAGAYTVTLTVYRNSESTAVSRMITVSNPVPAIPPVSAAFDFQPAAPQSGDTISFYDRSTGSPTSWSWSFGDGGTSYAQSPNHTFTAAGGYTVSLTVSNGLTSSTTSKFVNITAAVKTYRSLVSVAAQTNGVGGSVWRTELSLFNAGSEATNVNLIFIPGAGGSMQSRTFYLAPKQAATWANALLDIFGNPSGAGALAIEADGYNAAPVLKVSSRTFTDGSAGTYGQAVPEVGDLNQTTYLTGLAASAAYRTNVGLVNRTNTPASVTMTLVDQSGGVVGYNTVSVPPASFQQAPLASFFPSITGRSYDALSMKLSSSTPDTVSVYASVVDNRTQDPVYMQATPGASGSSMIVPAVGRVPGVNGTFWRSDVVFYNPTPATMGVSLRYLAAGADNRNAKLSTMAIGPGQTVVMADIVGSLGISSGNGALELSWTTAAPPIVTSRTYTSRSDGGTYGQSIDPVARFGSDQYVPGLRSDGAFRTNVGLVNSAETAVGVTVSLLSQYGQPMASAYVTIAPKSPQQFSLTALFPGINPAALGSFTLQAHTDSAASIFAYGSIVDNTSGDPVFFAGQ